MKVVEPIIVSYLDNFNAEPEEDFLLRVDKMISGEELVGHFVTEPIKLYSWLCDRDLRHKIFMASPLEWVVRVIK